MIPTIIQKIKNHTPNRFISFMPCKLLSPTTPSPLLHAQELMKVVRWVPPSFWAVIKAGEKESLYGKGV
jgi:hypothetical protein